MESSNAITTTIDQVEGNNSLYDACMLNLFQDWPTFVSSLRIVNTLSWPQEFYTCLGGRDPEPPPPPNTSASSTTVSYWSTPQSEQVNQERLNTYEFFMFMLSIWKLSSINWQASYLAVNMVNGKSWNLSWFL